MMSWGNCKEWAKSHQVTIVSSQSGNAPLNERNEGVHIVRVLSKDILHAPFALGLKRTLESLGKIDIMRLHYPHPFFLDIGVQFCINHSIPYVLHMHGKEIEMNGLIGWASKKYNSWFLARALKHASRITSHTQKLFKQSIMLQPYKDKMRYVSSGVDVYQFKPSPSTNLKEELGLHGKKIIFSLCVLRDYKGVHYLVNAMKYIVKDHPNAILLIGGGGPQKEELQRIAHTTGVVENVRFLGFIPERKKTEYFAIADVFCMPSPDIREGFGLVAADAVAMQIPTVVTEGAGISEQFEKLGIKYVTGNKSDIALAQTISSILTQPPALEVLQGYRQLLEKNNSWAVIAQEFLDVFTEILE